MYGINEFLVLSRAADNLRREGRDAEHMRWIKEADREERQARRRWSSFLAMFLF